MPSTSDTATLSSGRGRRIAIGLLILLLILLPLYLWPLRAGLGARPWATALTDGLPKDPRDPAALAGIPGDVWDALMNEAASRAPGAPDPRAVPGPRNLTMIGERTGAAGLGLPDPDWSDVVSGSLGAEDPPSRLLARVLNETENASGDGHPLSSSIADQLGSWPGSGQANAGPWPSGGGGGAGGRGNALPGVLSGLSFGGDEPGVSPPGLAPGPDDPVAPHPTPEPGTIALVALNVALLSAVAWKRRRHRKEPESSR